MACAAGFEPIDMIERETGSPSSNEKVDGKPTGRGTALKPAHEPIALMRKPREGFKANDAKYGTGYMNRRAAGYIPEQQELHRFWQGTEGRWDDARRPRKGNGFRFTR